MGSLPQLSQYMQRCFGLAEQLSLVADPQTDDEGMALERARAPQRSRQETSLDDNF